MKTLNAALKDNNYRLLAATLMTLALLAFLYMRGVGQDVILSTLIGVTATNLIIWKGCGLFLRWATKRDREDWEARMLRAMQLAKAADEYYSSGGSTMASAYHNLVGSVAAEGFKKEYIDKNVV